MCISPITQILASKPFNHIPVKSWQTSSAMKPQNLLQDGTMAKWESWLDGSHTSQQRVKLGTSDLLCFSFVPLPAAFQACHAKPSSSEGETDPQDVWSMTFLQPLPLCHECSMMGSTMFQRTPLKVPSMNLSNQCYLFIVCGQWSQKSPWFGL